MINFKKLFKNNEAVSPVIGVVLMVAITVILAAAVGSSVFGKGPAESAPQANLNIKAVNATCIQIEHLGGNPLYLFDENKTRVTLSLNGDNSQPVYVNESTSTGLFEVGMTENIDLSNETIMGTGNTLNLTSGSILNIKIGDIPTGQLICDKTIRF